MDFKNMLERERLESKKISKTQSVTSQIERGISSHDIHVGPSDHVDWLDDRKWAYIRLEGRNFGDVPVNIELKVEVWDSPNSAGLSWTRSDAPRSRWTGARVVLCSARRPIS